MSTPSIAAPSPRAFETAGHRAWAAGRRLIRGAEGDPRWSRPLLLAVAGLAGLLTLWGLTRNGYANGYYAEAAQAASHSWTAWATNALDVSGFDSVDKGPLSNVLMGLSGRLFGFSSFSMLLPEALCGVASVLVLHSIVRRSLGHRTAILAALMLALTPIFIAMSRFNNPDALLVLTEVLAAWALVRALESGRTRHVLLCGAMLGLAFNVKMLEAYLVVPAIALTLLVAGRGTLRGRLAQLAGGGIAMLAVSFAWYGTMMLLPAADRPWVGDTVDDSWFTLIFGANGVSRVSGAGGGGPGGFGGSTGPLRLFNSAIGGQIAWLLPLALCGLALGLWSRRFAPRTDRRRAAYLLWGGWSLVSWAVFSFSSGIFHPYYTSALAPAVAVLAAAALVLLWDRSRRSAAWSAVLAASLLGTATLAALLLARAGGFLPWLAPTALALAVLAAAAVLLRGASTLPRRPAVAVMIGRVAIVAGLIAVLSGPASFSIATVGRSLSGTNPLAGPAAGSANAAVGPGGSAGAGALAAFSPRGGLASALAGRPRLTTLPGSFGARPAGHAGRAAAHQQGFGVSRAVVRYLEAHQGGARYMAAAVGSTAAANLALSSGRNVIDIGGFAGSDPSPSLARLQELVHAGELHYVLLAARGPGGGSARGWNSAARARDRWVELHGKAVKIAGRASSGVTLYYLATSA